MSNTNTSERQVPFSEVKIRVGALVYCGDDIPLIRRDHPGAVLCSVIGGNVEPGEDLADALARELREELALDVGQAEGGELIWMRVSPAVRATLGTREYDELADGGTDTGHIQWTHHRAAAELPLFPPLGPDTPVGDAALPPVTDDDYQWV